MKLAEEFFETVNIASGFQPFLLGKTIGVLLMDRKSKDVVDSENMTKHVGVLESYSIDQRSGIITFRFQGPTTQSYNENRTYAEVYLYRNL